MIDAVEGVTTMLVGVGRVTVSGLSPTVPSLTALIVSAPFATALTTPLELTVASAGFELCHATVCPVRMFPCASLSTADAWVVWPTDSVPVFSDTAMAAAGTSKRLTTAVAFLLCNCAEMITMPLAIAVTSPLLETVASDGEEDDHLTPELLMTRPLASYTVAASCCVCPL